LTSAAENPVCVYHGESLGRYGFGGGHPFSPDRMASFWRGMEAAGLDRQVHICQPVMAERAAIERFHTPAYVDRVIKKSATGDGFLDYGDTPAFRGVYEASATVVGSVLDAVERLMRGECRRAFVPIAGLHHARRDVAGGFCVFNDCGVAIETLKSVHHLTRIAYVDIDAHHGDGVFYGFEDDPTVIFADLHEDGRYLYPGTGSADETGKGAAQGAKLNIPMPPGSDDQEFHKAWLRVEEFLEKAKPEFILFQCGADSVAGDPLTHMRYSPEAHAHAARRLCEIADRHCQGRILGTGGGGYNHQNIAAAWTGVVKAFLGSVA
jgi:acetoin utilization protein AcuC